jgi:hypothetical protein
MWHAIRESGLAKFIEDEEADQRKRVYIEGRAGREKNHKSQGPGAGVMGGGGQRGEMRSANKSGRLIAPYAKRCGNRARGIPPTLGFPQGPRPRSTPRSNTLSKL